MEEQATHRSQQGILEAIETAKNEVLKAQHRQAQQLKQLFKQEFTFIRGELERIKTPIRLTLIVLGQSIRIPGLQQGEGMSYTVPRDHADEPFTLDPIVIQDSEGAVDIPVTETVESDNPDVVSVLDGSFHFGTFGNATVSRKVTLTPPGQSAPQTFNAGSAVFNVTPGAISVTGNINVPGLTPDPEQ